MFLMKKEYDDTRLVYIGTSRGLNKILWALWFSLSTVASHLRFIDTGSFMGDLDIGDCWHNFVLNESIQELVGLNWINHDFDMRDLGPLGSLLPKGDNKTWNDHVSVTEGESFKR